jgi:two-component system, cell cycle sensor histidine kinase and response regulator CckA
VTELRGSRLRAGRLLFSFTLAVLLTAAAAEILLPEHLHAPIVRPAGVLLLIGSFLWIRALRRQAAARSELLERLHVLEEAERELGRSEERLRLAQTVAYTGTWDLDLTSGESTWSESLRNLMGVTSEYPAGFEDFLRLVHPDDRREIEAKVGHAYEHGGDFEFEYRLLRPDGETRWMMSRGRAFRDEGAPARVVGVSMDIGERKSSEAARERLEHALRQAHKLEAVGRLAGGVAHDFNNLLLGIRGYGELALNAIDQGDDAREDVEEMLAAADRAAKLTGQLLAFSRKQVLQPQIIDLSEVVRELEKLLARMIGEDVELDVVLPPGEVYVDADRGQIEQVIANLAVNAREAMPAGGRLTLEVATVEVDCEHTVGLAPGRYAHLVVSDSGEGMDAVTAAQIFEPFFTTKPEGTGLGLATVHGIVTQSGGTVWVYSEPGKGATFKVYLPLSEQGAAPPSPRPADSVAPGSGETILLVEDDPLVRPVVARMLESWGYRVLVASDGEAALAFAEPGNGPIDLLLSDLIMPGLGGREIAERLGRLRPGVRVLHMSGYTDDAVIRRGVLERDSAFIQKPFGSDELARTIRQILDDDAPVQPRELTV